MFCIKNKNIFFKKCFWWRSGKFYFSISLKNVKFLAFFFFAFFLFIKKSTFPFFPFFSEKKRYKNAKKAKKGQKRPKKAKKPRFFRFFFRFSVPRGVFLTISVLALFKVKLNNSLFLPQKPISTMLATESIRSKFFWPFFRSFFTKNTF